MATGYLWLRHDQGERFLGDLRWKWKAYWERRRMEHERQQRAKVDSILDKIREKGYENLSPTEKRILEQYSRQRRDRE
jgi:hypothetical protein